MEQYIWFCFSEPLSACKVKEMCCHGYTALLALMEMDKHLCVSLRCLGMRCFFQPGLTLSPQTCLPLKLFFMPGPRPVIPLRRYVVTGHDAGVRREEVLSLAYQ